MSELGQKRKWRHFQNMSAVPPTIDIRRGERHVCFVPTTDLFNARKAKSNWFPLQSDNTYELIGR